MSGADPSNAVPLPLLRQRGHQTLLPVDAYKHFHWPELTGGDRVLTIPYKWQPLVDASNINATLRFDYVTGGFTADEFATFDATVECPRFGGNG